MSELVLSLFPGLGLLDIAFEEAGFCVVRGPDLLWGGDIRQFHAPADRFDGVIGGPPCQAFSQLRFMVQANGHKVADNLIPEYERVVNEAKPAWFVMENVPAAPLPRVPGYRIHEQRLRDHWCDGGVTSRERRISFGTRDGLRLNVQTLALHTMQPERTVVCDARVVPVAIGGSGYRKPGASGGRTSSLNRGGPMPQDKGRVMSLTEMASRQGVPQAVLECLIEHGAFTASAIRRGIGNGVPLPMGRAIARAVRDALSQRAAA